MNKVNNHKINKKSTLLILIIILIGIGIVSVVGSKKVYDMSFERYERPDYELTPGLYFYDRVSDVLPRQEKVFYSNNVKLQGYYYPTNCDTIIGLIIISHGMHAGADDYLPIIIYLTQKGFNVFSYDCKGTYDSEGDWTVGMIQPLVDLNYAIEYIKKDNELSKFPLFLLGHSWGGYACASVLSIQDNIKACACIAPFNNGYTLIADKGEEYAGKIATSGIPRIFLDVYQKILFKNYINYNGVKGINDTAIPVLIAHGINDEVISYNEHSIISHKNEIRSNNVFYVTYEGLQGRHNTILHSLEAIEYQKLIAEKYKELEKDKDSKLTYQEKVNFYKVVDNELFSQINKELIDQIITMFIDSLK